LCKISKDINENNCYLDKTPRVFSRNMEEEKMSLILGMDVGVFIAWISTILAALLCVFYGIYHEFIKKTDKKVKPKEKIKDKEEE